MMILNRKKTGMVLVTVIAVIIALSIFAVSFISQNLNQATPSQAQIDKIKARELTAGWVAKTFSDVAQGVGPVTASTVTETMDGKTFSVTTLPLTGTTLTSTTTY